MNISKIVKDWFTGPDGDTHDPARALWVLGMISVLVFSGYMLWKTGTFNIVDFGIAYGGLLAAGAAGVKIKESTEPKSSNGIVKTLPKPVSTVASNDDYDELPKPPKG